MGGASFGRWGGWEVGCGAAAARRLGGSAAPRRRPHARRALRPFCPLPPYPRQVSPLSPLPSPFFHSPAQVVYGVADPNPLVGGGGLALLEAAGVVVEGVGGEEAAAAEALNPEFMARMRAAAAARKRGLPDE